MPHRKPAHQADAAFELAESELAAMAIPRPPRIPQEMAATPHHRPRAQSGVRWVAADRRAQRNAERLEAITEGPPALDEDPSREQR